MQKQTRLSGQGRHGAEIGLVTGEYQTGEWRDLVFVCQSPAARNRFIRLTRLPRHLCFILKSSLFFFNSVSVSDLLLAVVSNMSGVFIKEEIKDTEETETVSAFSIADSHSR